MTRDEFASYIVGRSNDVMKVGKVMRFVDGVLKLQSDRSRPVFVFEVSDDISSEDILFIDSEMAAAGIACVLVPSGLVSYAGEVTSESFGVSNYKDDGFGISNPPYFE